MDKIRVLQLGNNDWSETYTFPDCVEFCYMDLFEKAPKKLFDVVFIDRILEDTEIKPLMKATKAYTLFILDDVLMTVDMTYLFDCKKGQMLNKGEISHFLTNDIYSYFPKPYGEKFKQDKLTVSRNFAGSVKWDGNSKVDLDGDFGQKFCQVMYWRNNIPIFKGQTLDLWLEYHKEEDVSIFLKVTTFANSVEGEIIKHWEFDEDELKDIVTIDSPDRDCMIFIALFAKGKGKLQIISLHDRHSRRDKGYFLPGGERYVTSDREEIFCYFDPGDLKPPLNVYFSGYKTMEGFEGYYLMRKMGCPFLLISDARLEGGSFYMGTPEYEQLMTECIRKYISQLGFTGNQVIMSGLSMGTFGALYYGCDILPHAILLGKPLASIGDVAANERILRPGGFPTSLDILKFISGDTDEEAIIQLNNRFWDKFDKADWKSSKFIMSYMIEDDYDATAYNTLITHIQSEGIQIYGKGIHGRHNDNTSSIVNWFTSQYEKILTEDFSRRIDK